MFKNRMKTTARADRARLSRSLVMLLVLPIGASCAARRSPLETLELGIILTTEKEDHCFMFGSLGLSEEKSKEYLSGLGYTLAFSDELVPWPDWSFARIAAVHCDAGPAGASRFIALMTDPTGVENCSTLDELIEKSNCIMLVNTGGKGERNRELVSACLQADRPIFVDKFLSPKLSETRELITMARRRGVPLASASLLWLSQPGLELKAKLGGRKPTKVTSTGWSGTHIAGDIHVIAHMQLLAGRRRPVSVRCEEENGPKAIVTFDDGLVGDLVPRKPGTLFELQVVADGDTYHATYEGKHSRPSAANVLGFFFDFVRGKNKGMPAHVMEDAVAIWEAAGKARETGKLVMIREL